jgi:two-component system response regulator RegX3
MRAVLRRAPVTTPAAGPNESNAPLEANLPAGEDFPTTVLKSGEIELDLDRHECTVRGQEVQLPLKEFELLEQLLSSAGRVVTRETLIDRVWGYDYVGDTKTLDVHIKRLRSRIELDPAKPTLITTIRGLGYRLEAPKSA